MIDLTTISQWCISITGILIFLKWISAPVKHVLNNNKIAMESLQKAINKLTDDLKDNDYKWANSQAHRDRLQAGQDAHETRIGLVEDKTIIHDEQIKTLFKMKEEKK
ncbi:ATPase [Streptococcus uberis]|uniref:ATPase n=1 Tax=Streptococcus uberis TaxID=1349 RepID=UPI0021506840|nr:ATPase [Streptococcus uberis]MCR4256926.1 ATPase [Streptococcus uberis]